MPRCEGLPSGPCPVKRHDNTVKLGEGDLMLCRSCDTERHRQFLEQQRRKQELEAKKTEVAPDRPDRRKQTDRVTEENKSTSTAEAQAEPVIDVAFVVGKQQVVMNELLMYAVHQRNRSSLSLLQSAIFNFYTGVDITAAKKQLISSYDSYVRDSRLITERRSSTQRSASEAEVDDTLELLDIVDNLNVLSTVQFGALKYDRLPKYGPEELNICSLLDHQKTVDKNMSELTLKVGASSSKPSPLSADVMGIGAVSSSQRCSLCRTRLHISVKLSRLHLLLLLLNKTAVQLIYLSWNKTVSKMSLCVTKAG